MGSQLDRVFSEEDREAIRAATAEAEKRTAAELVVYVADRCEPHPEAAWKASLIGAAWGTAVTALALWLADGWSSSGTWWILVGAQLGLLAGWIASRLESVARLLIDREALEARVRARAAEAFLEEQVFATADRTGILIFVALFEHRVIVLPDRGIADRVEPSAWNAISSDVARGIR